MRNMLAFLAALGITVAVAGHYLGWYQINSILQPNGNRSINIEIDTKKVGEDLKKGGKSVLEKGRDLLEQGERAKTTSAVTDLFEGVEPAEPPVQP